MSLTELLKSDTAVEVVCDHILGIFTAGRHTTAAALSVLFWAFVRRPDVGDGLGAGIIACGK